MVTVIVLDNSAVTVIIRIKGHCVAAGGGVVDFIVLDDRIFRAPYPQRHMVSGRADMGIVHHIMLDDPARRIEHNRPVGSHIVNDIILHLKTGGVGTLCSIQIDSYTVERIDVIILDDHVRHMQIPVRTPDDNSAVMHIISGCCPFDLMDIEILEHEMLIDLGIGPAAAAAADMNASALARTGCIIGNLEITDLPLLLIVEIYGSGGTTTCNQRLGPFAVPVNLNRAAFAAGTLG